MKRKNVLCFDMDGTFVDLYGVDGWLADLESGRTRPYVEALPLVNLSVFARLLNRLRNMGYAICVVSWGAKNATEEYLEEIEMAKRAWLIQHLASVQFDGIEVLPYGTPKWEIVGNYGEAILFDDEEKNRNEWEGSAFSPEDMFEILKELLNFEGGRS
jgi:phosphoserine phosphatase